jgi:F-type H+-transporting ATPase subunit alpha
VGGNAQITAMKQVAGRMRMDLAQYRELEAFSKFGSDLDKATQAQLRRGERLVQLLKQDQYQPMNVEEQVAVIFAGTTGMLDSLPTRSIQRWGKEFLEFLHSRHPDVLQMIAQRKELNEEIRSKLKSAVEEHLSIFRAE